MARADSSGGGAITRTTKRSRSFRRTRTTGKSGEVERSPAVLWTDPDPGKEPGMAKPNPQLEAALAQFAAQPGTTPDQQAQLRDALTADADRLAQLNQDAALGRITGFALESAGSATQIGRYDKQAGIVSLPTARFQQARSEIGRAHV